jgi:hypothetical protein
MKNAWWSIYPLPGNFGDVLNPYVLNHLGVEHRYEANKATADSLFIGSIAKFAREGMSIYGSGTSRKSDRLNKDALWHWVRGPLTRDCVISSGGSCPEIYGDLGLFISDICPKDRSRCHSKIGIVPHYVDYEYVIRLNLDPKYYTIINVLNSDPIQVAAEIAACSKIISSSLHGIIAAHSYEIPAAWTQFSANISGDGLKFADYLLSVGADVISSTEKHMVYLTASSSKIDRMKHAMINTLSCTR